MARYMASLDGCSRGEDTYLPGHGGLVTKAHDYVCALKAHRNQREAGSCMSGWWRRDDPGHRRLGLSDLDPLLAAAQACRCLPIWKS